MKKKTALDATIVLVALILERITLAIVGLVAALNNQTAWAVSIWCLLLLLIVGTKISTE